VVIVSYSRAKLWLHSSVGAGLGGLLLYYTLPPLLQHLDDLRTAGGRLQLIVPGVAIGLLAYGLATAIRAIGPLAALRTDGRGIAVTTLFGTTQIPWADLASAAFARHPKSHEPQMIMTYRGSRGTAQLTLHLSLTAEPPGGFSGIADRITEARGQALDRPREPQVQQYWSSRERLTSGFGRKQV
jgi:hypothetical protein